MNDVMMKLRDKILSEILEDLDCQEGMKLKPKAAVSITSISPKDDDMEPDGDEGISPDVRAESPSKDDMDDEDLKSLLNEYMRG